MPRLIPVCREIGKTIVIALGICLTLTVISYTVISMAGPVRHKDADAADGVRWIAGTKAENWVRLHADKD